MGGRKLNPFKFLKFVCCCFYICVAKFLVQVEVYNISMCLSLHTDVMECRKYFATPTDKQRLFMTFETHTSVSSFQYPGLRVHPRTLSVSTQQHKHKPSQYLRPQPSLGISPASFPLLIFGIPFIIEVNAVIFFSAKTKQNPSLICCRPQVSLVPNNNKETNESFSCRGCSYGGNMRLWAVWSNPLMTW